MDQIRAAFRYHITDLFPYCFHEDRNVWTEIFKMEFIMIFQRISLKINKQLSQKYKRKQLNKIENMGKLQMLWLIYWGIRTYSKTAK